MINKNNLFYFCSVVEYVARVTKNERKDIINKLTDHDIKHELYLAEVNHCLSFEQVFKRIRFFSAPCGAASL